MTELIWDGKFKDPDGPRTAANRVAPLRVALPFQTVETVNESAQQRESDRQGEHLFQPLLHRAFAGELFT